MDNSFQRPPVTIFCGKGGVGKTTLSLAYALRAANEGRTALVVTSHPLEELAVSVSLAGFKQRFPQAAANFYVIHIDPREQLSKLVSQQIPSQLLADAVLSSRIYQSLVEVAPGLKEMIFLSRLRQLAEQHTAEASPAQFDVLVWDAPATGHFLQVLQASRYFHLYLSGPFEALGREVAGFFSDPSNLDVIPVSTAEEMAVEETLELAEHLAALSMRPARAVCNMASPVLAWTAADRQHFERSIGAWQESMPELGFVRERLEVERTLAERLRGAIPELHTIARVPRAESDLDLLLDLSRSVGGLANA